MSSQPDENIQIPGNRYQYNTVWGWCEEHLDFDFDTLDGLARYLEREDFNPNEHYLLGSLFRKLKQAEARWQKKASSVSRSENPSSD